VRRIVLATSIATASIIGCASVPDPRAQDLTARQHENVAAREETDARVREAHYDPGARRQLGPRIVSPNVDYTPDTYNPTDTNRAQAVREREQARAHRVRAAELRQYEARECRWIPTETRQACPVLTGVSRIEDIEGGVRISFVDEQDMLATLEHLRCHLAFAAAEGREGVESCTLYGCS
jgi:hypothetical protein